MYFGFPIKAAEGSQPERRYLWKSDEFLKQKEKLYTFHKEVLEAVKMANSYNEYINVEIYSNNIMHDEFAKLIFLDNKNLFYTIFFAFLYLALCTFSMFLSCATFLIVLVSILFNNLAIFRVFGMPILEENALFLQIEIFFAITLACLFHITFKRIWIKGGSV